MYYLDGCKPYCDTSLGCAVSSGMLGCPRMGSLGPQDVLDRFARAGQDLEPVVKENLATAALAKALDALGVARIWTAGSIHNLLRNARPSTGIRLTKLYDLAWSEGDAAMPRALTQVKLGNKAQEDQEFLWFIGDIVFSALDRHLQPEVEDAYVVAFVPSSRSSVYWDRLVRLAGTDGVESWQDVTFRFDPCAAVSGTARGADWIDPQLGIVAPGHRSQYQKIFGVGTSAKFVGLFERPGILEIETKVSRRALGENWMLFVDVRDLSLLEADADLRLWWP